MTLRHLNIFRAVCREGSITKAAEALEMTQPAVSLAVKELEAFYRAKLFERMNRRIYITGAGRSLLRYADTMAAQLEESVRAVRDVTDFGECTVGANVTVGETRLPQLLKTVSARCPGLLVKTVVDNSSRIRNLLENNEIDFAVLDSVAVSPGWTAVPLWREDMVAVCAPDHLPDGGPLTPEALAGRALLLREKGSGSRSCVDSVFLERGFTVFPVMESASTAALLAAAREGVGIALLPEETAREDLSLGRLKRAALTGCAFRRNFFLVYHKNKFFSPKKKRLMDLIRSELEA